MTVASICHLSRLRRGNVISCGGCCPVLRLLLGHLPGIRHVTWRVPVCGCRTSRQRLASERRLERKRVPDTWRRMHVVPAYVEPLYIGDANLDAGRGRLSREWRSRELPVTATWIRRFLCVCVCERGFGEHVKARKKIFRDWRFASWMLSRKYTSGKVWNFCLSSSDSYC